MAVKFVDGYYNMATRVFDPFIKFGNTFVKIETV